MAKLSSSRLFRNVSWIFFGNVFHAVLNFLLGMYVARKLSLDDNGLINYATSWVAFFAAIASLGLTSTISREFAMHKGQDGECLCSGIVARVGSGLIAVVLLQVFVRLLNPGERLLHLVVLCQSTSMLFSPLDLFVYWFRYNDKADLVTIIRIVSFGISALWRMLVLALGLDLIWFIVGTVAETVLFGSLLAISFFKNYSGRFCFSVNVMKRMLRNAAPLILAALLSTLYAQADKIMLKAMMDNSAVALYSVAAHLATAIGIIPSALVEGFRADVMECKSKNEVVYQKRMRQLYCIVFWTSIVYCVFVALFPSQILGILYGEKYIAASNVLALIVWYSTFSYFGAVNNLFMIAEGKAKWIQITTLSGAVANVLLNWLMIPSAGIVGAAMASLLTQFVANFMVLWIVKDLRPAMRMMVSGIVFRDVGARQVISRVVKMMDRR